METKKRYYRKRVDFFNLLQKMKLWPSRSGVLHGIKSITITGLRAEVVTHCNETFWVRNSKNSRAARWLRNKWYARPCGRCRVPDWKLEKYGTTFFKRGWGSSLAGDPMVEKTSKDGSSRRENEDVSNS